jgi:hypothetical protein
MANDKEEQQHQHIPTESKDEEQDKGNQGSGGLLSMVGDPAGPFSAHPIPSYHPNFPPST